MALSNNRSHRIITFCALYFAQGIPWGFMLLTLPWILALVAGRVTCVDGEPDYKRKLVDKSDWSMTGTGISVLPEISFNAKMMLITCLPYVLIQAPAWAGR